MAIAGIISLAASFISFGGVLLFTVLFVNKRFWSTFRAGDLLGLNPNRADLLFANGSTLAIRSFPYVVVLAWIASIVLAISGRYLLSSAVAWLPLLNFLVPLLLLIIKIIASR